MKKRIEKIQEYFVGIEITNNTTIIRITYPSKWGVFPNKTNTIQVAKSDEQENLWFYYADYEIVAVDEIFDLIDDTIKMNLDAQKKIELLHEKFEELKNLFASNSLETLETLYFAFSEPTVKTTTETKKKRTSKPRKKTASKRVKKESSEIVQVEENKAVEEPQNENSEVVTTADDIIAQYGI